ncbi:MAG: hypothetical protein GY821_08390 [Gammaproteobacteria bacterium]|nr:hypothetical protein [Gammaproteobacteria bacterium]
MIAAISLNPIIGTLLTFSVLAIKQAFKQEANNSQDYVIHKTSTSTLGGKYGVGMPVCFHKHFGEKQGDDIADNDEYSTTHDYERSIT